MQVSGIDANGDWRFGRGRAVYVRNSDAVRQNVVTRLRSFTNDWFLDVDHGLPWLDLLGRRNAQTEILREIERSILNTPGVRAIVGAPTIAAIDGSRTALISVSVIDIFDTRIDIESLPL